MAHELEILENGNASMAFVGETPWHGLGTEVQEGISAEEIQEAAGLNWGVVKIPATIRFKGDDVYTGKDALVRETDGKVFDMVGPDWNPVQNSEAFEFFKEFCDNGDMSMNTAGSLKGGQMVWALAKIKNGAFEAVKNDRVDSYLLFSNPHKYGSTVEVRFTNIRVVCNNTLTLAMSDRLAKKIKVNHSKAFDADLVKETLGFSRKAIEKMAEQSAFLASKSFNAEQLSEYINTLFPIKPSKAKKENNDRKVKEISLSAKKIFENMDSQPGVEFGKGSFWQLFNGVTYATDHLIGNSADSRLASAWYGVNQQKKIEALKLATEMAMAA